MGMASAGARAYKGSLVRGSGRQSPLKAENLLASGCRAEAANLSHSVRTLTLSKYFMKLVPALFRSANVLE